MGKNETQLFEYYLSFHGCLLRDDPEPEDLARDIAADLKDYPYQYVHPLYLKAAAFRARALADALDDEALKLAEEIVTDAKSPDGTNGSSKA